MEHGFLLRGYVIYDTIQDVLFRVYLFLQDKIKSVLEELGPCSKQ